jgi:hypothetical protein
LAAPHKHPPEQAPEPKKPGSQAKTSQKRPANSRKKTINTDIETKFTRLVHEFHTQNTTSRTKAPAHVPETTPIRWKTQETKTRMKIKSLESFSTKRVKPRKITTKSGALKPEKPPIVGKFYISLLL